MSPEGMRQAIAESGFQTDPGSPSMPDDEKTHPQCVNCAKKELRGGALGLCARCYAFQRRHNGTLPPLTPGRAANGQGEQLTFHLPRRLRLAAARQAYDMHISEGEWWRRAGASFIKSMLLAEDKRTDELAQVKSMLLAMGKMLTEKP